MKVSKFIAIFALLAVSACTHMTGKDHYHSHVPSVTHSSQSTPTVDETTIERSTVGSLANPQDINSMNIINHKKADRYGSLLWLAEHQNALMKPGIYAPYTPFPY